MIKINLVAEGRKPVIARQARPQAGKKLTLPGLSLENAAFILLVTGAALILLGGGIYWWMLKSTVDSNDAEIRQARKRADELREVIRQVEEFERREQELQRKIDVITDLKNNQRGPVDIMDTISRALPEMVWLDRLDMRGDRITLSGRSFNENAVAQFVENLDDSPIFDEPSLPEMRRSNQVFTFRIDLTKATQEPEAAAAGG